MSPDTAWPNSGPIYHCWNACFTRLTLGWGLSIRLSGKKIFLYVELDWLDIHYYCCSAAQPALHGGAVALCSSTSRANNNITPPARAPCNTIHRCISHRYNDRQFDSVHRWYHMYGGTAVYNWKRIVCMYVIYEEYGNQQTANISGWRMR